VIPARLRNWNHSVVPPIFWKIAKLKARIKNVCQENRCSPWNVLEEDVGYTVTNRCFSTLQFLHQVPNLSGRLVWRWIVIDCITIENGLLRLRYESEPIQLQDWNSTKLVPDIPGKAPEGSMTRPQGT
jgi:hypothetical protein